MKNKRRIFLTGFACVAAAYCTSALISVPGLDPGQVKGSLLHQDFGAAEFAKVFILTFVLCLIAIGRLLRPFLRAVGFASGFALFAIALLLIEARLQSHGLLTEHVIRSRFGSEVTIYLTAAAVGVLGLVISVASAGKRKRR